MNLDSSAQQKSGKGTDSHFLLCWVLHETSEIKGGPVINNIQKAVLDPGLVFLISKPHGECILQGEV